MSTIFSVTRISPSEFHLHGELDIGTAAIFEEEVTAVMPESGPVTLDLSGLTFLDSSGTHAIHDAAAALDRGSVRLVGAHGAARRVIEISGFADAPGIEIA
ncbi:MAG TPA: STAS domain-containing protein [Actinomycetota bacterium]